MVYEEEKEKGIRIKIQQKLDLGLPDFHVILGKVFPEM